MPSFLPPPIMYFVAWLLPIFGLLGSLVSTYDWKGDLTSMIMMIRPSLVSFQIGLLLGVLCLLMNEMLLTSWLFSGLLVSIVFLKIEEKTSLNRTKSPFIRLCAIPAFLGATFSFKAAWSRALQVQDDVSFRYFHSWFSVTYLGMYILQGVLPSLRPLFKPCFWTISWPTLIKAERGRPKAYRAKSI